MAKKAAFKAHKLTKKNNLIIKKKITWLQLTSIYEHVENKCLALMECPKRRLWQ